MVSYRRFGIIKAKLSWQDNTPTLSDIKHITINQGEFTSNYFFDVFLKMIQHYGFQIADMVLLN